MAKTKTFADLFREAEGTEEYLTETAILEFTEDMVQAMAKRDVSRSELARRIDSSPAHVTQILRGTTNFTLKSMVKIALALDMKLHLHLAPSKSRSVWTDIPVVSRYREVIVGETFENLEREKSNVLRMGTAKSGAGKMKLVEDRQAEIGDELAPDTAAA